MILAEDVKRVVDLVELIKGYTRLKRVGNSWRGPCPLHRGEDPNLAVYPETQSWFSYVCGKGGDVFDFLQMVEGIPFRQAYEKLAADHGIETDTRDTHLDAKLKLAGVEVKAFDRWLWLVRRRLVAKLESLNDHEAMTTTFAETVMKGNLKLPPKVEAKVRDNFTYVHVARDAIEKQLDAIDFEPKRFIDRFLREFYGDKDMRELVA